METYAKFTPMAHTQAPIENRMAHVWNGGESYFTDQEAETVLPEIKATFSRVVIVKSCPSVGFTRLAACGKIG